jgi:membrane fusion protein (multidrug efflux system)
VQGVESKGAALRIVAQLFLILLLLAGAGGAYWYVYGLPWQPAIAQGGPVASGGARGGLALPVETVEVKAGPIQRRLTAVGTLRSGESVVIKPEIDGRVVEIGFVEGQAVTKGQLLVSLDRAVNEAEVAAAQAAVDLGKANFERQSELGRRGSGTRASLDQALGEMRTAEASLALAKARMGKLTLTAPFDGIVGLRNVSVGDFVESGDAIVNLEQIDPLKVDFRVAENFLAAVHAGQRIEVGVDAFGQQRFAGEVYAIDPLIDESGRSIVLRAMLPNPDGHLRPGLFARVELVLNERADALQVPEAALVPQGTSQLVFKVVDGKAALTRVQPGIRRDGMVEIVEGLAAGDIVVTAGQIKLRDGAAVQPTAAPSA